MTTRPQPRPRGPRPAPDEQIDPVDTRPQQPTAEAPAAAALRPPTPASPLPAAAVRPPREGQIPLNVALPAGVFSKLEALVARTGKTKKILVAELITREHDNT